MTAIPAVLSSSRRYRPLVDSEGPWRSQSGQEENDRTHWSIFYSSNFKIYWDWLVFANNSQANSSTKHWNQKRPTRLAPTPKQEAHGCKNVSWSVLSAGGKKKKIRTRALKVCPEQNSCKNRTVFFFPFDYLTHFVTNRFMIIIDIKSVSYWTIFPMKINKPQVWLFTNQRPSETWERK